MDLSKTLLERSLAAQMILALGHCTSSGTRQKHALSFKGTQALSCCNVDFAWNPAIWGMVRLDSV